MSGGGSEHGGLPVSLPWRAAHLVALAALSVTQPVLDLLGGSPTFFVAHTAGPALVLLVGLLCIVLVPAVLIAVELLVSLVDERWGWRLHLVLIGALGALLAAQFLDRVPDLASLLVLGAGVVIGVLLVHGYRRSEVVRSVLSALALTPLLFAWVFVFASPTHGLVFPPEVEAANVEVPGKPPPIFVVVFDELPLSSVLAADGQQIDAATFPNLARLADDGVFFRNVTSVAGYTHEAVPAILTGDRVHAENVPPTAGGHPRNLFSFLADDYRIAAHEQITQLCTPALCDAGSSGSGRVPLHVLFQDLAVVTGRVSLPAGLDDWLPPVDDSWSNFGQNSGGDLDQEADRFGDNRAEFVDDLGQTDRVGDFRRAVAGIHRRSRPTLTFIHTVLPHVPWIFHADGSPYVDPGYPQRSATGVWTTSFAADFAMQRHLLQAEFADHLLGELLDRIEQTGQYDDALIVFTADHGVSLEEETNRRMPSHANLDGVMPVPVVVKAPHGAPASLGGGGRVGTTDDRVAETIDLLPTIADELGVDLPWPVDGQGLFGPERQSTERSIYARGRTVHTDERRLDVQPIVDHIRHTFATPGGTLELYGLGPGRAAVGRRVSRLEVEGAPGGCFASATPPGVAGEVLGSVHMEGDGQMPYAVVVDGRVVGTSETHDTGGDQHHVVALADPAGWPEDPGDVQLWRVVTAGEGAGGPAGGGSGLGLVRLPSC